MNQYAVRGAVIGAVAGAAFAVGGGEALNNIELTDVSLARDCAQYLGHISGANLSVLDLSNQCPDVTKAQGALSPTSLPDGTTGHQLTITVPSAQEYLAKEIPKAEASDANRTKRVDRATAVGIVLFAGLLGGISSLAGVNMGRQKAYEQRRAQRLTGSSS